ncbi:SPRY domain-containing SOCS box protein 3 isoform X1 [Sphaerodactylus townsendi]|uniref:SPRY domain-containing SOCS box protein 3 isoform X1 n=1 Tax=Sphaerodactylus townsendi TaxID=933632 RepID=UPI0020275A10|nr:SPRY domain-containing SOCS box protein 3 isoform X1 [Sphaerodactylus townsendi]XP_048351011.1 SPRY domain-containing SOCS box protein 3 isoform X1 [Sphaerodactylus townsendi]XP_048351012.1 SPRY domain-containing SOCS box protein 3 isoform X1 [Sphaerodactylus townsendi]XP_048351014.1 SPRY domain-containing SOCS box protein 3 isoform X1 [Sphaerodactylus townsendi]
MPGGFSPTCLCMWGLLHHKGDRVNFSTRFGQGSIIGVHLDTWHGTLTFFKNRKCIGSRFLRRVVRAEAGERRRQGAGPESTGGAWWLCCGRGRMRLVPQWWENPGCSSGTGVSNLYHPKSHLDPFSTARRSTEAGGGFLQFAPPSPFLEETPSLAPPTSRPRETTEYRVKAACGSRAAGCRPLL